MANWKRRMLDFWVRPLLRWRVGVGAVGRGGDDAVSYELGLGAERGDFLVARDALGLDLGE